MRLLFRPSRLTAVAALAFLVCVASRAHAGYAMVAPPPAVLTSGGTTTIAVGSAANSATYSGGYVMARGSLTIGARTVTVPIAYRVAANAATFAATRLNPYVAGLTVAVGAASLLNEWFSRDSRSPQLMVDASGKIVFKPDSTAPVYSPGWQGATVDYPITLANGQVTTPAAQGWSCSYTVRVRNLPSNYWGGYPPCPGSVISLDCIRWNPYGYEAGRMGAWESGGTGSPMMCTASSQVWLPPPSTSTGSVTTDRLASLSSAPINPAVLPALGEPVPVDPAPVINPATTPSGTVLVGPSGNPAPSLQPAPLRIPDGEPVPIPNTSPQQYNQPWLEIVPAPTPSEPYRVDVRPITTVVTSPVAPTEPVTPTNPATNPGTPTQADLCQKYPNIVACQSPGDVTDSPNPAQPRLYERKYPDGFAGVWDAKKAQLMATPVAQLMSNIMPRVGDGGCPRWEINLNVGIHDYGTHPLGIPCEYWGYIRVILIISALFMARALIFGG